MLDPLLWLTLVSVMVTGIAATGTKVLAEFSRHDLEMLCRRKNRREMFDEVLERHENFAVAAETLQIIGGVAAVLLLARWVFSEDETFATAEGQQIAILAGGAILLLLVFTIWIPWAIVHVWSAAFLYHSWPFWILVAGLMWPLTRGERLVEVVVMRLAGHEESEEDEEEAFEDEIRTIVAAGLRDGLLVADAREMIEGVIELGDVEVDEIMTPRSKVDALDVSTSWEELLAEIAESGRTRMPVYEDSFDNVLGILLVKDLLAELCRHPQQQPQDIRRLLRKPWFIPESKRVDDVLREFRRTRSHMAIVVDEYRAIAGVVTIEDALEEIVGEIADESDCEEELELIRTDERTLEVDGRVHINELNEQYGLMLSEPEEFETIAGFVVHAVGRIPKVGEVVYEEGVRFTVLKSTPRRVERLRLEMLKELESE